MHLLRMRMPFSLVQSTHLGTTTTSTLQKVLVRWAGCVDGACTHLKQGEQEGECRVSRHDVRNLAIQGGRARGAREELRRITPPKHCFHHRRLLPPYDSSHLLILLAVLHGTLGQPPA